MQGKLALAQSEALLFSIPDPLNTVLCLTLTHIYKLIHIIHKQLPHGHLSDLDVCVFKRTDLTGHEQRIWTWSSKICSAHFVVKKGKEEEG